VLQRRIALIMCQCFGNETCALTDCCAQHIGDAAALSASCMSVRACCGDYICMQAVCDRALPAGAQIDWVLHSVLPCMLSCLAGLCIGCWLHVCERFAFSWGCAAVYYQRELVYWCCGSTTTVVFAG
jgi:hypothetical protein